MSVIQTAKRLPDVFCLAEVASIPALLCLHCQETHTKPTSRKDRYVKDITHKSEKSFTVELKSPLLLGLCPLLLEDPQRPLLLEDPKNTLIRMIDPQHTEEPSLYSVLPAHS